MSLQELLAHDAHADKFYHSLHPSVRHAVDGKAAQIMLAEDLVTIANRAMSNELSQYEDIFDDSRS